MDRSIVGENTKGQHLVQLTSYGDLLQKYLFECLVESFRQPVLVRVIPFREYMTDSHQILQLLYEPVLELSP